VIHWELRSARSPPRAGGERGGGAGASARDDACLTGAERASLAGFRVAKRRADWLAGRVTAKAVVARAMQEVLPGRWPLRAIEIATEPSGAPCARLARDAQPIAGFAPGERLPISVSISHAEEHALAAATCSPRKSLPARSEDPPDEGEDHPGVSLGADLGAIEPRSPAFVETFLTPEERRFVAGGTAAERDLRANLVWCAKEAVLKAFGVGLTVDTLEVSCLPAPGAVDLAAWPMSPPDGAWRPFLAACGAALVQGGATIHGVWRAFPGFVGALAARG
jgi:4'-phosphopantetheinyl transferase